MMSGLGRQSHPCSCSLGRAAGSGITRSAEALAAPPGSAASPAHSLLHPEPSSPAPAISQALP